MRLGTYLGSRGDGQVHYDYARFERGYGAWPEDDLAERLYWPFTYLGKLSWIHPWGERAEHHRQALRMICRCIWR